MHSYDKTTDSRELSFDYNGIGYRFPEAALAGTGTSPVTALVSRPGKPILSCLIWDQTQLGSTYLKRHGCSFCALATMLHALMDSSLDPVALRQNADKLLGVRAGEHRVQYSRIQRAVQRRPLPDLLGWSGRMPLNIAGAVRIMECYMDVDYLDGGTDKEIRRFLLEKAGRGLPVIATGRFIPSVSGDDLCPHATHTFLIIGMKDASTLIACDSSGATKERIKYVHIDDLICGVFRSGIRRGLARRQYYFTPATAGGLAAPAALQIRS